LWHLIILLVFLVTKGYGIEWSQPPDTYRRSTLPAFMNACGMPAVTKHLLFRQDKKAQEASLYLSDRKIFSRLISPCGYYLCFLCILYLEKRWLYASGVSSQWQGIALRCHFVERRTKNLSQSTAAQMRISA
jgi:hypothetical protein